MKNLSLGPYKNVNIYVWDVGGLSLRGAMLDKYVYCAEVIKYFSSIVLNKLVDECLQQDLKKISSSFA